jgi:hypothetical protein
MATNFPTSVDNFTNPTANDSLNLPSHSTQHANANDAIEAVEDYLLNGAGKTGLVHINTTSITSASLISVNNCFTSAYDNYRILFRGLQNTNYGTHNMQFTIGGTVTGNANFGYQGFASFQANSTAVVWTGGATTNNAAEYGANGASANNKFSQVTEILQPAIADATFLHTQAWSQGTGAGTNTSSFTNGWNNYTTAGFDGFRITTSAGTMTATVTVYGYRKS